MKKIKYLLIMVVATMIAVSCGNDEDEDEIVNPLVGSWVWTEIAGGTEIIYTVTFNANFSGSDFTILTNFDGETENYTDNFTWSSVGDQLTIVYSGEDPITLTYSISGNTLTLTEDSDIIIYTRK